MGKTSAAIAHELKNSLNGLGMAVELIAHDPANEARVARLRPQVAQRDRAPARRRRFAAVVSRARRASIARRPIWRRVSRARRRVSRAGAERGVAIAVHAPPRCGTRCDAHKVQGVVVNLVKNAIEAGKNVERRAAPSTARRSSRSPTTARACPRRRATHLFEPFFTTKPNGTGLGLPTSRRFIEAHGGSIEASGRPSWAGRCSGCGCRWRPPRRRPRQRRRRRAHEADRAGDRRREDVPHRRRGGAGGGGLRVTTEATGRPGWRRGSASRAIS
jgi:signal transduction histidine kinase